MRFEKADDNDHTRGSITGISLNGLNSVQRQHHFAEWAKIYCEYFPSFEEAKMSLPFAIKLPNSPVLSPIKGIYVLKGNPKLADLVIIHYEEGVHGITLTITYNFMELRNQSISVFEQTENNPMALGWSDGELCYVIIDGWENKHTQNELAEVLLSLK